MKLVLLVDLDLELSENVMDKIIRLNSQDDTELAIIIHAYAPSLERRYFFESDSLSSLRETHLEAAHNYGAALVSQLETPGGHCQFEVNIEKDPIPTIERQMHRSGSLLIALHNGAKDTTRHLNVVRRLDVPLLILSGRPWPDNAHIAVAVDPLHEHDKPRNCDSSTYQMATSVLSASTVELHVVHSYHLPPIAQDYKQLIYEAHKDAIRQLESYLGLKKGRIDLIKGNPEDALPDYIKREHINILALGSVARNSIERLLVGSTSEQFIHHPPCDLLLVHPEHP